MSEFGCKVCRVLVERDMQQYEDQLLSQWLADDEERKGYRQLATWLNVTMLRREMERAGRSTIGAEAESKYERLQRDDAVADEVTELLTAAGVDVASLLADFVSYGVVRTHLIDCLGAEWEAPSSDWEADAVEVSENHARRKITEAVQSAHNKDTLRAGGPLSVHVHTDVECESCHERVSLDRAFERGYVCACSSPDSTDGP